jgi:hypothetical protein
MSRIGESSHREFRGKSSCRKFSVLAIPTHDATRFAMSKMMIKVLRRFGRTSRRVSNTGLSLISSKGESLRLVFGGNSKSARLDPEVLAMQTGYTGCSAASSWRVHG